METMYELTATARRWQDWLNLILGLWLIVVPFLGTDMLLSTAAWTGYGFGLVIALLSGLALYRPQTWEEWTSLAIGLLLIASPFVLGFTSMGLLMWNYIVIGFVIAVDALWAALSKPIEPTHHEHVHHA